MINYGIKYAIITNNLECQFGLHHCDGLVETIEMNLSFDNFGVGMQKILWDADVIMTSTPQHPYDEHTGNDGRPPSGASPLATGPHRVNAQAQIWGRVQRPYKQPHDACPLAAWPLPDNARCARALVRGFGPAGTDGACGLARRRSVPQFSSFAPFFLLFSLQIARLSAQENSFEEL
jgi:hypothetical protein